MLKKWLGLLLEFTSRSKRIYDLIFFMMFEYDLYFINKISSNIEMDKIIFVFFLCVSFF